MTDRSNTQIDFRVPAEWEPQETVYFGAYPENEFDPSQFEHGPRTILDVQLKMVAALISVVKVKIIGSKKQQSEYIKALNEAEINLENISFVNVPHCDIWLRDTGPIWGLSDKQAVSLWLGFDNWGYYDYIEGPWAHCDLPNFLPQSLANHIEAPWIRTSLVGEGGDKSFNGSGSLICNKTVELNRNPSLDIEALENLLHKTFNVSNVIWVEHGLADDTQTFRVNPEYDNANLPGGVFTPLCTGGHVDEFCRFVGPSTILLAEVIESGDGKLSAIEKITKENLEKDLKVLRKQTDENGNPLEIIRMPLPPNMIYTIDLRDPVYSTISELKDVEVSGPIKVILAASYCNYLICNGVICFPQYYLPGMDKLFKEVDAQAMSVIKNIFPTHKIIPINPRPVNAGGGGMHCISNNQPKVI